MSLKKILADDVGVWIGILTGLASLYSPFRRVFVRICKGVWFWFCGPSIIFEKMTKREIEVNERLDSLAQAIAKISSEVRTNGGSSLKDAVLRTEESQARSELYRKHDFWGILRPALEMNSDAMVSLVSESACLLFQAHSKEEVFRRSWLRFVEERNELLTSFLEAAKTGSKFSYHVTIFATDGSNRGSWELKASPIYTVKKEGAIYVVSFFPLCEVAREVAEKELHWTN